MRMSSWDWIYNILVRKTQVQIECSKWQVICYYISSCQNILPRVILQMVLYNFI